MENYTSDSSDSDSSGKVIDLAYLLLETTTVNENLEKLSGEKSVEVESIILHHNQLISFPQNLFKFENITILDVSNNGLEVLPDVFEHCKLTTLIAKNNCLQNDSLPKTFTPNPNLRELNLSGNHFETFPEQVIDLVNLKYLYLGGNKIKSISKNVWKLSNLQILSIGGNQIIEVPSTVGQLTQLHALVLCDNKIENLPSKIANLHNLKSLLLHKNKLRTLPPEIIALKNLTEVFLSKQFFSHSIQNTFPVKFTRESVSSTFHQQHKT